MRLALGLTSEGIDVGWVDNDVEVSPLTIRRTMERDGHPPVLIVDDADKYGAELPNLAAEVAKGPGFPIVILGVRSGRAERIADRLETLETPLAEVVMPLLADSDIEGLLDVLDQTNRLGVLKGRPRSEQFEAFRRQAGRQLLVAMLEATSGRRFEAKIIDEMDQLGADGRSVYGIAAIATAIKFGLTRDELLLAVGDASNATLGTIDTLGQRHLLVSTPSGELKVRHRVIAEVLLEAMAKDGSLMDALRGLAVAAASKVGPSVRRGSPAYRRVRALMNHDWLKNQLGSEGAKRLYAELEPFLQWDYHYWLQRGSTELESGDITLAENFLNQANALQPDDALVQTEYGYLQLKLSVLTANGEESREQLATGMGLLENVIRLRGGVDPQPYHIIGRQGLIWSKRGDLSADERTDLLTELARLVDAGYKIHHRDERLRTLLVDIQNERLALN